MEKTRVYILLDTKSRLVFSSVDSNLINTFIEYNKIDCEGYEVWGIPVEGKVQENDLMAMTSNMHGIKLFCGNGFSKEDRNVTRFRIGWEM